MTTVLLKCHLSCPYHVRTKTSKQKLGLFSKHQHESKKHLVINVGHLDSNIFFCTHNWLTVPFNNWLKFKASLTIAFLASLNHNYDYDQLTLEKGKWIKIYQSQARDVTSGMRWSKLLFPERLHLDDLTTVKCKPIAWVEFAFYPKAQYLRIIIIGVFPWHANIKWFKIGRVA